MDRTILFFLKNYRRYIANTILFSVLYAVFEAVNIVALFPIVNSLLMTDIVPTTKTGFIIKALNKVIGYIPVKDAFVASCIFVVIAVLLKNIFRYLYLVLSAYGSYKIWEDFQGRLFVKYINADYRFFLDRKHGEIAYRLYDIPGSAGGVLRLIPQFFTELLKIITIAIFLLFMSLQVTLAVLVLAGVFYYFTKAISNKISYALGKGRVEATQSENIIINEMINGIKQIKVFLAEKRWVGSFFDAMKTYFGLARRDTLWMNMPVSALEIFALTALVAFLVFLRKFSPQTLATSLPLLAVFAYAFQRIMPSISLITTYRMQIMSSLPALEMLHSAVEENVSSLKDGDRILESFDRQIEFRNVYFSYPGRREGAMENISLSFEKNKCTAIAGASGSGKTTIVNLIIRLFDPTKGAVLVDGNNIRGYRKSSWLGKIGFVSQDTFIFHATVRENIGFGLENVAMEDIERAGRIANAHDFIMNLPHGYETVVGEKGMKLSGGERQRLAIARAILRDPQILIFDEATSALDNVSQDLIQAAINRIVKDHTVILIAHRLSTIVHADKIVVLDKGRVREVGSHNELIAKRGFYWRLYSTDEGFKVLSTDTKAC